MATLSAKRATAPVYGPGFAGDLKVATGTIELAANPPAATVLAFCTVPAGAVVVGGWLMGDDIDTGTEELDIDIGWADDTDGLGNLGVLTGDAVAGVKPEVGLYALLGGKLFSDGPVRFDEETQIIGTVVADAAGGGTGTLSLVVLYFIDPNFEV